MRGVNVDPICRRCRKGNEDVVHMLVHRRDAERDTIHKAVDSG